MEIEFHPKERKERTKMMSRGPALALSSPLLPLQSPLQRTLKLCRDAGLRVPRRGVKGREGEGRGGKGNVREGKIREGEEGETRGSGEGKIRG